MRVPRLRFSIWMLMIVVALAAFGVWVLKLSRLSREYAGKAQSFKSAEMTYLQTADAMRGHPQDIEKSTAEWLATVTPMLSARDISHVIESVQQSRKQAAESRENAERHAAKARSFSGLARTYMRAARYPWLPVEPDPPAP